MSHYLGFILARVLEISFSSERTRALMAYVSPSNDGLSVDPNSF